MHAEPTAGPVHADSEANVDGFATFDQVFARLERAISSTQVARVVVEAGQLAAGASSGALVVLTPDRTELRVLCALGDVDGPASTETVLSLGARFPLSDAVRERRELWLTDPDELARRYPNSRPMDDSRGWAVLLLQIDGVILGAVGWSFKSHWLSSYQRACLRSLASVGGVALYRASVFDSERSARMQAELGDHTVLLQDSLMAAVSSTLDSVVDLGGASQILDKVAHLTLPRLGELCSIQTQDDRGRLHQVATAHLDAGKEQLLHALLPPPTGSGHRLSRLLQHGKPLLVRHLASEPAREGGMSERELQVLRKLGIDQLLVLPLRIHGQTLGIISFGSDDNVITRSAATVALAERVARRCAAFLEYVHLRELAERANRARDDFVAATSHELRTPLSHIKGFVSTLRTSETAWDEDTRDDFLAEIEQEADRLTSLVETLLDLSRSDSSGLDSTRRAPTPPASLIAAGIERIRLTLGDRLLDVHPADDLPLVWADGANVERVISNLLENAAKYSPPSEPISIVAKVVGKLVMFRVEDRGLGIPSNDLERIFEPFFREPTGSYPAKPGTGLGLAICRSIIRSQRGRIWAEHRPGGGAVIAFTLPIAAGSQGA